MPAKRTSDQHGAEPALAEHVDDTVAVEADKLVNFVRNEFKAAENLESTDGHGELSTSGQATTRPRDLSCVPSSQVAQQPIRPQPVRRKFEWGHGLKQHEGKGGTKSTNVGYFGEVAAGRQLGNKVLEVSGVPETCEPDADLEKMQLDDLRALTRMP